MSNTLYSITSKENLKITVLTLERKKATGHEFFEKDTLKKRVYFFKKETLF